MPSAAATMAPKSLYWLPHRRRNFHFIDIFIIFKLLSILDPVHSALILVPELPQLVSNSFMGNQSSLESFTGLSGKSYSLHETYPDWEVVQHANYGRAIFMAEEKERWTFKCKVVRPIVHPEVYYRIFLHDDSTLTFTGGRKVSVNERGHSAAANSSICWVEEYEFDVPVNTSMKRAQCLGMDVHSRNKGWRGDAVMLVYAHAKAPTLKVAPEEDATREFRVGEVYKLECPVELGLPHANVTWTVPSGEHKVSQRSELYVEPVQKSDQGQYTCLARNKYGSVSFTFTVQLQFPPPSEHLKILWQRFQKATAELKSLILSMPVHIRSKLMGKIGPIGA